jgi:hypothetical protein
MRYSFATYQSYKTTTNEFVNMILTAIRPIPMEISTGSNSVSLRVLDNMVTSFCDNFVCEGGRNIKSLIAIVRCCKKALNLRVAGDIIS